MAGGHIPSKIAETATTVRTAQGSTVGQARRRGVFVIPKERKRGITDNRVGVNAGSGDSGLNIVI